MYECKIEECKRQADNKGEYISDTEKIKSIKSAEGIDIWFDSDAIEISPYILLQKCGFTRARNSDRTYQPSVTRNMDVFVMSRKIYKKGPVVLDISLIKNGLIKLKLNPTQSFAKSKDEYLSEVANDIVKILNQATL